jgi:hypothetical protein
VIDLWTTLIPLVLGSAILPIQIAITVLLLRSDAGRVAAIAWVGGMTVVRLAQGIVFGLVFGGDPAEPDDPEDTRLVASTLLLVVAIVFLVTAARKLLRQPDDDAPPPAWMSMVESVTPARAFLLGAGVVAISAKLWAFTLAAIGAIAEAGIGQPGAAVAFLIFIVAAQSIHLGAIGITMILPERSDAMLERVSGALQRYDRAIMVTLGLVFGGWLLLKALTGLGVL